MKTIIQFKRLAYGASALVVGATIIGTTGTAAAHQKDHEKNKGSIQNNKNQRNTRNYNYTYNINYNFNDHGSKPKDKQAFRDHSRNNTQQNKAKHASSHKQNRVYTERQWVYDPRLCRWVEIGYNKTTHRWELMYANDRKDSRRDNQNDNRNYSYWYND